MCVFLSEWPGSACQRASDHRRAAETNDDAPLQETGGPEGEMLSSLYGLAGPRAQAHFFF